MTMTREQEFKSLLTKNQFLAILNAIKFTERFVQLNTYYDSPKLVLANSDMGLRIRQFSQRAEQTLKVPRSAAHDLTEITDPLTIGQAVQLVQTGTLFQGQVTTFLTKKAIEISTLKPFSQAKTIRRTVKLNVGLLTVDQTFYLNGTSDYELELEYTNAGQATAFFAQFQNQFHIVQRPVINKVVRARENT